ncbi:phosphoribosyltransferase [Glaciihabitans sp. dw_435]|uniref:phosphoribosyltransferase n=1 Tax=Glaciihabitans sp. dw_435 TaxID=2720081 RepID=UPI001BD26A18|nr:phosphoribosyltransferase family protein [Glaciihabitans sp. dw_435]
MAGDAPVVFTDRVDAGRRLAARLDRFRHTDAVVVGIPRGGVPVAFEIAAALGLELGVVVVRKLGVPFQEELAMGAVAEGGVVVLDQSLVNYSGLTPAGIAALRERERTEVDDRAALLHGRARLDLAGRVVIAVDDGIATGATARAACLAVRAGGAARIVMAAPVAPAGFRMDEADDVVCVAMPDRFFAVGSHYTDFAATTTDEVVSLLARVHR